MCIIFNLGKVAVDVRSGICYMIYLFTAIGFPPGGSGRYTCTKIGKRIHKRGKINKKYKKYKKHRIHKIRQQKYKTKSKH